MTVFVSPSGLVMGAQNGVGENKPDRGQNQNSGPTLTQTRVRSADFSGVRPRGNAWRGTRQLELDQKVKCPALFLVARDDASGDGPCLIIFEGTAHAQSLVETHQGEPLYARDSPISLRKMN
jgi:hypothetical protein